MNTLNTVLSLKDIVHQPIRTRIAPSPTGFFHLGTARCAIQNKLVAQASGGSFLLRIDDTDAARNNMAHVDLICSCLDQLGLDWDDMFFQSARRDQHQSAVRCLLEHGLAYNDQGAVLLSSSCADQLPDSWMDVSSGMCTISSTSRDQARTVVLLRSDGSPTYQLASIVDDIDMKINLILRGVDHIANTPKQLAIALALAQAGWPQAQDFCNHVHFAHVGLIMHNKKKLSKRDAGSNLQDILDQYSVNAVFHWAMMLGWGHPDSRFDQKYKTLDRDQIPMIFAQGRLKSANCDMNLAKLGSLQKAYR